MLNVTNDVHDLETKFINNFWERNVG